MKRIKCEKVFFTVCGWNTKKAKEGRVKFKAIFGTPLFGFMDPYTGFDTIAFDDWIGSIDGQSCKDRTLERYGQDGLDLILNLMKGPDRPDAIETPVDMDFDILKSQSTTGFERCEYTFHLGDGSLMEGTGYYKAGLVVHRQHLGRAGRYLQMSGPNWQISTKDGVRIYYATSLAQAKRQASAFGRAFDFEKAQTITLTKEQFEAAKRVNLYFNPGEHSESES